MSAADLKCSSAAATISGFPAIFASYYSLDDQTVTGANAVTPLTYNAASVIAGDFQLGGDGITVPKTGTYEVLPSLQIVATGPGTSIVFFWLQKSTDGSVTWVDELDSCTNVAIGGVFTTAVGTVSLLTALNAGDAIRVVIASSDVTAGVEHIDAVVGPPTRPANPSIITTIKLITTV
jgi:hypothetical protein